MKDNGGDDQITSKTDNSLSKNDSIDYGINKLSRKALSTDQLDLNDPYDRKFAIEFFKKYYRKNKNKFNQYICVINMWTENLFRGKTQQSIWMIEIKNIS